MRPIRHLTWTVLLWAFALALGGCNRKAEVALGAPTIDVLANVTDSIVLRSESLSLCRKYVDQRGVPTALLPFVDSAYEGSVELDRELKYLGRKILTFQQLEALEREQESRLPEYMRGHPKSLLPKWNIQPERLIVYSYEKIDQKGSSWPTNIIFGAFRESDGWHLAVDYSVFESLLSKEPNQSSGQKQ